jgi:hypothetical protein
MSDPLIPEEVARRVIDDIAQSLVDRIRQMVPIRTPAERQSSAIRCGLFRLIFTTRSAREARRRSPDEPHSLHQLCNLPPR